MSRANVKNKIYYYQTSEEDNQKEQIFKIFDVEYVPVKNNALLNKRIKDRTPLYEAQLEEMKIRMDKRKND